MRVSILELKKIAAVEMDIIKPDRRQSKTLRVPMNADKNLRNRVFDCHLSSDWRQMAIKNTVSSDF